MFQPTVPAENVTLRMEKSGSILVNVAGEVEQKEFVSLFQAMQYAGTLGPKGGVHCVMRDGANHIILEATI